MAWWNRKKESMAVTVPKRPRPVQVLQRGRVDALQGSWYSVNRSFLNSPNNEIRNQLEKTRELSRLLCSIDPYAAKYIELLSVNTCGSKGFKVSPKNYDANGVLDDEVNSVIAAAWNDWAECASFDKRFSFAALEQTAIRSLGRDGEALFRVVRGTEVNKYGFALQPIDPALLDVRYTQSLGNGRAVVMGVEYEGVQVVAYHIWNQHTDDLARMGTRERERIPADEIIHVYDDDYGQLARGLPWLTPSIQTLARLHEYLDAHLTACQVAASAPLVMTSQESIESQNYDDVAVTNRTNSDGTTSFDSSTPAPSINLTYSQILELPANKKLEALNLGYPQQGLEVAVKTYLQSIAAGWMVSYASLTSDGSKESYSTVRFSSIAEREHWAQVQRFFSDQFHKKVFRAWLECAFLTNAVELQGQPEDYQRVEFLTSGWRSIDPSKDLKAYQAGIAQGHFTHEQVAAELGTDWKANIIQLAQEQEFARKHGIALPTVNEAGPNEMRNDNEAITKAPLRD
jgi:lambda family phage portal protein